MRHNTVAQRGPRQHPAGTRRPRLRQEAGGGQVAGGGGAGGEEEEEEGAGAAAAAAWAMHDGVPPQTTIATAGTGTETPHLLRGLAHVTSGKKSRS